MCYDIRYMTKKQIEYANRYGASDEDVKNLQLQLLQLEPIKKVFHTNGFMHWKLPVITNTNPNQIQFFQWGLIPFWTKDLKSGLSFSNKTLNARGETIFKKPAFRSAAKNKRCIIILDGFYEHHHIGGKTQPYHIQYKDEAIMSVAGLWEQWVDKTSGEVFETVTIVTTEANKLMAEIHNNPKAIGPRMPVILSADKEKDWLKPIENDEDLALVNSLIEPLQNDILKAYPVASLRGKAAVGNTEKAIERFKETLF